MRNPDPSIVSDRFVVRAIYWLYFGCAGLAMTYFPYLFESAGLTAKAIGLVVGGRVVLGIVAQPMFSELADRRGPRGYVMAAFALGGLSTLALSFAEGTAAVAATVWLSAPLLAAVVPLLDGWVVRSQGVGAYGHSRLWGSIGYGVVVALFGAVVGKLAHATAGRYALWVYGTLMVFGILAATRMRPLPATPHAHHRTKLPLSRGLIAFSVRNGLHWASCVVFNVYLSLHVRDEGMAAWVPGAAVAVAVVAEVVAFAAAPRFLPTERDHRGQRRWFALVAVTGMLRWVVTAWAPSIAVVVAVQAVHFLSFGVWFSCAMLGLGRYGPPERRTALQGVFAATCFGGGGLLGSLVGGAVMDAAGGAAVFALAVGFEVAALVWLALLSGLERPPRAAG